MTEVQRRRPRPHRRSAQIIDARPIPRERWEAIIGTRSEVLTILRRGQRRREFARVGQLHRIGPDMWRVNVQRIRSAPPRWARPTIIAGCVLAGLSAFATLGVLAFLAIGDALAGRGTAVMVGVGILGFGLLAFAFRRPVVEVMVRVR
jgi:hypothetical protein